MILCCSSHASKALEVLKKLPSAMIVAVCPRIILTLSLSLDLPEVSNIDDDLEFISAVAVCHETARATNPPGIIKIEDLNNPTVLSLSMEEIKNRFFLKVCNLHFGIVLSIITARMSSDCCTGE